MSSIPTTPYIHPGDVLNPTHQRTTSRCEKVLREVLAKDAHRHPHRPFASTERARQNNDSVKHWLAQTDSSKDLHSQLLLSNPSLARSNSLSSHPTYLTTHLPATINLSHCPLANDDPLAPSPAVPEPHARPSSHLGHTLSHRHRHHQSLTGPLLAFQASPLSLPLNGPPLDNSHLLPDQPTQQQQHSQITSLQPRNSSLGPFGAPTSTQWNQTPPSPIQSPSQSPSQSPATAAILRTRCTSMNPNDVQNSHPRLPPRVTRKPSASSANLDHSPTRSMSQHHPRPRLRAPYLTDWTTAESPDDESTPSLTPPTASSRNLSFSDSMPAMPPTERAFTPPCTPPSFNIKVANEVCRSIQGYVSFFEVEGLGRPLAEIEEERLERERLEKEQRAKRNWLAWFASGVFRASSNPSGA